MRTARSRLRTRILADARKARLSTRTLRVSGALRLRLHNRRATRARVARVSSRTHARRPMVVHPTLRTRTALARILAALVAARQTVRALRIAAALGPSATAERIAAMALEAVARSPMIVVRPAFGIRAALDLRARVATLAIDARLRGGAIGVRATADLEAAAQRISGEAVATDAQRPMRDRMTVRIRAARVALGARIAALLLDARPIVGAVLVARALRLRWDGLVALLDALHVR